MLKATYDVVVVDSPPAFTDHVLTAFDHSEHFVLLSTLDVPALEEPEADARDAGDARSTPVSSGTWCSTAPTPRSASARMTWRRPSGTASPSQVPSSRAVPSCINRGVPIILDQPGHPVSVAVRRFARQLESQVPVVAGTAADEAAPRRKDRRVISLLRRSGASS